MQQNITLLAKAFGNIVIKVIFQTSFRKRPNSSETFLEIEKLITNLVLPEKKKRFSRTCKNCKKIKNLTF